MTATHYCTYCDYYSRRRDGKKEPGSTVYTGTRKQVMAHANIHPIGTPYDMAAELPQTPYADDEPTEDCGILPPLSNKDMDKMIDSMRENGQLDAKWFEA